MKSEADLRARFDQFDAEKNGYIDEAEFTALVRRLGLHLTDAKATKAFRSLDTEGEGRVDFEKLNAWWFKFERR